MPGGGIAGRRQGCGNRNSCTGIPVGKVQRTMEMVVVKSLAAVVLAPLLYVVGSAAAAEMAGDVSKPKFASFPVSIVTGVKVSEGYRVDEVGMWRDGMGKHVRDPVVNFAGRYHLGLHSCGAGCRYYTLIDLASGDDLSSVVEMFGSMDPPSRTSDGLIYVTDLLSRPDSRLLVAQYILDTPSGEQCRERLYVLDGGKLGAISQTRRSCERW